MLAELAEPGAVLTLTFLTPLRLIYDEHLVRRFGFASFYQRLLERLYGLAEQFSPSPSAFRRPELIADVERLLPLAEQVQVMRDRTAWWDVKGYSKRQESETHLGGLVGSVELACADWTPLLANLLWGQSVQIGKNVVKGGGWYELASGRGQVASGR
jgi:hypothetical protein